jgi:hypothetical protein
MLVPPAGVLCVYAAHALGWDFLLAKVPNEAVALGLMLVVVACFAVRWVVGRRELHLVLLSLSVAFLCREVHFAGTTVGVWVAAAAIGVWAYVRREVLLRGLRGRVRGRWLLATGWSYLLALLVQQRALKFLPHEHDAVFRAGLEEVLENLSHLMLGIAALL